MSPLKGSLRGLADRVRQQIEKRRSSNAARRQSSADRRLVFRLSGKRLPNARQLKHLPRFLSPNERRIVKLLLAAAALSAVALVVRYVSSHVSEVPAPGGEYEEASVGGPRFVNPILAANNDVDLDIIRLVYSGLVKNDGGGKLVADLASGYEVSEDGRIYTFTLRDDVTWHDGAAFGANDVIFTFDAIRHAAWKSPLAAQFKNVAIASPDPSTVTFTLEEPFAPFLSLLSVGIIPEHLWQEIRPENAARAELNVKPVGTGPFRFKNFTKDKKGAIRSYTLARNENYYGQKPYLDSVTFTFYPDFAAASEALLKRRVDGVSFLPLEFRDDVDKLRTVRIETPRLPQYTAVFFNQKKNDALSNKAVRQALAAAIDKDQLVKDTLGDSGVPVHGPILPGFVGFHPDVKKYPYDPSAAAELLTEAGWPVGDDGIRGRTVKEDGEDKTVQLKITLTTVDTKENISVAQAVKRSWEGIGVLTELEIVPASRIQKDKIRPRDYEALLYGEIIGSDPDPYPFWHSSQNQSPGLNLAVFGSRRVDELLEQARSMTKDEDRAKLYVEFQDILAEEVPTIFLYSPTYTFAVSRKVRGIGTGTIFTPADRFADIGNWYVKTGRAWR